MKVWVADELGQIKSCSIEDEAVVGKPLTSEIKLVSSNEEHDHSDYVQIMAHVKWEEESSGKSRVPSHLSFIITSLY
jgi:hypothetical protein